MNLSDEDKDNIIRTIIGEVDPGDPDQGRAAVAHVILNRTASGRYPTSPTGVVHQRGQFEAWDTRGKELSGIKTTSPEYQHAQQVLEGVLGGDIPDPTGGATHFLDRDKTSDKPGGIDKLAPWANKSPALTRIGGHTFYAPEGTASWSNNDLLGQYVNPKTTVIPAKDQALLDQYTAGSKNESTPAQKSPIEVPAGGFPPARPAPTDTSGRLGYSLRDIPSMVPYLNPVSPESISLLGSRLKDTGSAIADAFKSSTSLMGSGVSDLQAGNMGPSFPSSNPRTWSGGGILKTGAGALGAVTSPITGAITANVEEPATQLTGNPDFGAKLGLASGMITPGAPAVKAVSSVSRKLAPATSALDKMVEMIGPENVPAVVARLRSNPRLNVMDTSDPVRVASQGLIDPDQPVSHRILSDSAKERTASAPAATNEAYSSTLGPVPDVENYVEGLKKKAQAVGQEVINPVVAGTKSVDITSTLKYIDDQIGKRVLNNIRSGRDIGVPLTSVQKDFLELRDRLRGNLEDRDIMLMDPNQAHEIQSGLRYEGSTLMKAGGQDALRGRRFMDVRQRMVDALDAASPAIPVPDGHTRFYRLTDSFSGENKNAWFTTNPDRAKEFGDGKFVDIADSNTATLSKFNAAAGMKDVRVTKDPQVARNVQDLTNQYKPALAKYRDAKNVQEAFEDGVDTLKNRSGVSGLQDRPEFLSKWILNATPEELEARKVGTRVAIDQAVGSVKGAARKGADIPDIQFNRAKLRMLFGNEESDRLFTLMQDARDEATTNSKLIQGSKTEETRAGKEALKLPTVEPFSVRHSSLGLAGAIGLGSLMTPYAELGGLAAAGLTAANVGGAAVKGGVQRAKRALAANRNIEFSKLATATGGENNPVISKLLSHPSVQGLPSGGLPATNTGPLPQRLPMARDVIERGLSGRPTVSRRMVLGGGAAAAATAGMGGGKSAGKLQAATSAVGKGIEKTAGIGARGVQRILSRFEKEGLTEDRLEYGIDDLMSAEGISRSDAAAVQKGLHEDNPRYKPF